MSVRDLNHFYIAYIIAYVLVKMTLPGNPDGAATVGHARREVVDGRGLVGPGQATLVILNTDQYCTRLPISEDSAPIVDIQNSVFKFGSDPKEKSRCGTFYYNIRKL